MDALPIEEKSGVPHASSAAGVMHACGHDGHVAMALAAAKACVQLPDIDGTVHFVFQPAEESEGGAKRMIDDGLFRIFPCQAIYALHNWPALPLGTCVARDGAMMAAFGVFEIEVTGTGCHGAMPHQGSDVLLTASHIVSALQSVVSRNIDPMKSGVVSVTQIHGGSTWNVIPGSCTVLGTTRCFDEQVGYLIALRVEEIAKTIAAGFRCEANVRYQLRAPVTINDPAEAGKIRDIANAPPLNLDVVDGIPSMGSEDFAHMLMEVPGCYVWLGSARAERNHPLHSPYFDFNDALTPIGAGLWVSLIRESLVMS
jgi:amidohydrolase